MADNPGPTGRDATITIPGTKKKIKRRWLIIAGVAIVVLVLLLRRPSQPGLLPPEDLLEDDLERQSLEQEREAINEAMRGELDELTARLQGLEEGQFAAPFPMEQPLPGLSETITSIEPLPGLPGSFGELPPLFESAAPALFDPVAAPMFLEPAPAPAAVTAPASAAQAAAAGIAAALGLGVRAAQQPAKPGPATQAVRLTPAQITPIKTVPQQATRVAQQIFTAVTKPAPAPAPTVSKAAPKPTVSKAAPKYVPPPPPLTVSKAASKLTVSKAAQKVASAFSSFQELTLSSWARARGRSRSSLTQTEIATILKTRR